MSADAALPPLGSINQPLGRVEGELKTQINGGWSYSCSKQLHFYFSQRFQMWFNMQGRDLRTFWYRTVNIGQGDSTGWAKKFEKISNFSPFRHFTSIYLRNDYKQSHISSVQKKVYPSPIQLSHVYGPVAHAHLSNRVSHKLSDVIPVLRITPTATEPSTVSVFLSVVKCGRVCRAQTCAHSGIQPSRLAKRFPRGGQKSSKKIEFLTISTIYVIKYLRNDYKQRHISSIRNNALSIPYPNVACVWTHRPLGSTKWSKNVECEWRVCVSSRPTAYLFHLFQSANMQFGTWLVHFQDTARDGIKHRAAAKTAQESIQPKIRIGR